MKPLVLYHANCFDGWCSAWVAHKAIGDIEAVPVQYGQDPPDVTGRWVYILDFSYKRPIMFLMCSKSEALTVLDHHKTAQEDLEGFVDEYHRTYGMCNARVMFDMEKSGGRLAWEHFFPGKPAPWLVDYTEDRDFWRWKQPFSREINAALRSYPMDFALWDSWNEEGFDYPGLAVEGKAILRREQQIIDDHVKHAREIEIDGHKVLCVNTTVLISEIAGELAKGRPFGACYFYRKDGKKVWSLRSDENGIDVSEIAKAHGGGGHPNAASFEE